jgi:hypothetical protein
LFSAIATLIFLIGYQYGRESVFHEATEANAGNWEFDEQMMPQWRWKMVHDRTQIGVQASRADRETGRGGD